MTTRNRLAEQGVGYSPCCTKPYGSRQPLSRRRGSNMERRMGPTGVRECPARMKEPMTAPTSPAPDTSTLGAIQRRIVLVLAAAQVLGGVGVATGAAVGALLAADMSSDSFRGLASPASLTGAALVASARSAPLAQRG